MDSNRAYSQEHNYCEEAQQLADWRLRAKLIRETSTFEPEATKYVFGVHISGMRYTRYLLMFFKPNICIDPAGRLYELSAVDFDAFVSLSKLVLEEYKVIGRQHNPSAKSCRPNTVLDVTTGFSFDQWFRPEPEFGSVSFYNFHPYSRKLFAPQKEKTENEFDKGDPENDEDEQEEDEEEEELQEGHEGKLPHLRAISAIFSLAYDGFNQYHTTGGAKGERLALLTRVENQIQDWEAIAASRTVMERLGMDVGRNNEEDSQFWQNLADQQLLSELGGQEMEEEEEEEEEDDDDGDDDIDDTDE